ncbi:hypothetical protein K443DRAFT_683358 [Laccaria amethystina LaAM-08-1]|uniref:Uncharacterized protein n=1 Tax=Laccaria amethystina LaAM-08-1 TaxID=1095629 RepID=A0A0C9XFY0_9AGAR|nr:hypothetical protein K443DRAFT_683358 [Laccaria amethystina LaAM-08-1]
MAENTRGTWLVLGENTFNAPVCPQLFHIVQPPPVPVLVQSSLNDPPTPVSHCDRTVQSSTYYPEIYRHALFSLESPPFFRSKLFNSIHGGIA